MAVPITLWREYPPEATKNITPYAEPEGVRAPYPYFPSDRKILFYADGGTLPHGWEQYYDACRQELRRFVECAGLLPDKIVPRPVAAEGPVSDEECLAAIEDFVCHGGGCTVAWGQ